MRSRRANPGRTKEISLKISVVTVSLNPGAAVARTIASVAGQTHDDLEWIVVDGASTDGSVEAFRSVPRVARLISEPDAGIADAMNKGLALAAGDGVMYLNAGDEYVDRNALAKVAHDWDLARYEWATGDTWFCRADGVPLFLRRERPPQLWSLLDRGCRIQHLSTVVARRTLELAGGFDTSFRIAMDYELWLRLVSAGKFPQLLRFPIGKFYSGGSSSSLLRRHAEDRRARAIHRIGNRHVELRLAAVAQIKSALGPLRHSRTANVLKELLRL